MLEQEIKKMNDFVSSEEPAFNPKVTAESLKKEMQEKLSAFAERTTELLEEIENINKNEKGLSPQEVAELKTVCRKEINNKYAQMTELNEQLAEAIEKLESKK